MPDSEERRSYPKIPTRNWWDLRRRFQQSMPNGVTSDYLQSVLGLTSAASAQNLIAPLRAVGLIDEDGKPTDRANAWRHDEEYAGVVGQMVEEIYPAALRDAFPGPEPDTTGVKNWFKRNTGAGESAAASMTQLYVLLVKADPAGATATSRSGDTPAKRPGRVEAVKKVAKKAASAERSGGRTEQKEPDRSLPDPTVHIDVQVHIAADASAEQIDQVFESMARHLYGRA